MEVKAKDCGAGGRRTGIARASCSTPGLANSSGLAGHYLMDQLYGVSVVASVPEARDGKAPAGLMGGSASGAALPQSQKGREAHELHQRLLPERCKRRQSSRTTTSPPMAKSSSRSSKAYAGSGVTGSIYGERVASLRESRPASTRTSWTRGAFPVIHMEYRNSQNEMNLAKDAADTLEELFRACGWDILSKTDRSFPPSRSIHEMGTCRFDGRDDPKKSVLNRWNQWSHDIKNLFVVDAAGFVTCGWQNPTMTILALSLRRLKPPRGPDSPTRGMTPRARTTCETVAAPAPRGPTKPRDSSHTDPPASGVIPSSLTGIARRTS